MTIPNTNFQNAYTTDGVSSQYSYSFSITDTSQVEVFLNNALVSGGQYTLTPNPSPTGSGTTNGGTITFGPDFIPAASQQLVIQRTSDTLQNTTLSDNEPLPPGTLEAMVDKLTIICQQIIANVNLGITFPPNTIAFSGAIANAPVGGSLIGVNGAGTQAIQISPVQAGYVLGDNGPGNAPTFQPGTTITGGNVAGPASATALTIPLFNDTTGKVLNSSLGAGTAGQALASQGAGLAPIWAGGYVAPGITAIWILNGDAIPAGWVLCDGSTVTLSDGRVRTLPNTIGMMLICGGSGANGPNAAGYGNVAIGAQVGAKTHTHTAELAFNVTSGLAVGSSFPAASGGGSTAMEAAHDHNVSGTTSGSTDATTVQPVAIGVALIMKL